jgi:hypothetical protein
MDILDVLELDMAGSEGGLCHGLLQVLELCGHYEPVYDVPPLSKDG